jgi:hypothetical protein
MVLSVGMLLRAGCAAAVLDCQESSCLMKVREASGTSRARYGLVQEAELTTECGQMTSLEWCVHLQRCSCVYVISHLPGGWMMM